MHLSVARPYICKSSKMEEEYERVKKIGAQLGIEPRTF